MNTTRKSGSQGHKTSKGLTWITLNTSRKSGSQGHKTSRGLTWIMLNTSQKSGSKGHKTSKGLTWITLNTSQKSGSKGHKTSRGLTWITLNTSQKSGSKGHKTSKGLTWITLNTSRKSSRFNVNHIEDGVIGRSYKLHFIVTVHKIGVKNSIVCANFWVNKKSDLSSNIWSVVKYRIVCINSSSIKKLKWCNLTMRLR